MKHCQPCNLDFPAGYRFCGSCGGHLTDSITCFTCGDLVDSRWRFCTGCGKTLTDESITRKVHQSASFPRSPSETDSELPPPTPAADLSAREWYAAPELYEQSDETTATPVSGDERPASFPPPTQTRSTPLVWGSNHSGSRNSRDIPTLTMLSAYGQPEPSPKSEAPIRYPVVLGLALIAAVALFGSGGWFLWSYLTNADAAPAATKPPMANQIASPAAGETPAERAGANSADEEWKRLRERRVAAKSSEADHVISLLEEAEEKYPNDYRFPYERAKLSIKGIVSHHEAFGALVSAGEKAINNGKAQEMLDNLSADKDGDFWKPSHGHREWPALEEALRNRDKNRLKTLH